MCAESEDSRGFKGQSYGYFLYFLAQIIAGLIYIEGPCSCINCFHTTKETKSLFTEFV